MKSALKKSVVSTSISLILASGMAAFAAHAADDVKLKGEPAEFGKNRTLRFSGHP
ncbi:sulfatase [Escherichia coli]|nr:sulfatase [Escherichia coli]